MGRPEDSGTVEAEGDIVVTPLGGRYVIGRVAADGHTQAFIEAQDDRTSALTRACRLAGDDHRVFLAQATRQTSVLVDCTNLGQHAHPGQRPSKASQRGH